MALAVDTILNNRYRIISILGQGGMGSVYYALDEILKINVAVKENLFLSEEYSRQFEQEAHILASVRHPNLPRVSDYFVIPGQGQYIIMDYIEGEDLRQRIDRLKTISEKDSVLIGVEICNALIYLHSRTASILHRDIKPGNIKITPDGDVILVDFGLAKIVEGDQATHTGARAMTPGYSPPEQYGTARTDQRSDIYSLGATLYAALTGIIPEDGLERMTSKTELTPLRQLQPNVNRRLANVIEKALSVEPFERYQSAEEFKKVLINAVDFPEITQERPRLVPGPQELEGNLNGKPDKPPSKGFTPGSRKKNPFTKFKRLLSETIILFFIIFIFGTIIYLNPGLSFQAWSLIFPQPLATTSALTGSQKTPTSLDSSVNNKYPTTVSTILPGSTGSSFQVTKVQSTPQPAISLTAPAVRADQIAFVSDRTGKMQIWMMNVDGSGLVQITNIADGACQPSWAPNGQKLAFISPCNEKLLIYDSSKIYITDLEGNVSNLPFSLPGDFDPAWSPDGNRLAFTSLRSGIAHILVYQFDDNTINELSDTRFPDMEPSWSPNGSQLAVSRTNIFTHIYIISDRGFTQFKFSASGNINDYWADWSKDGSFLIFSRASEETAIPLLYRLDYADRDSGKEIRISSSSEEPAPVAHADLSPDDHWIVFESWPDGHNHDIFLMAVEGSARQRITTDPGFDFYPTWRPSPNQ